MNKSSGTAVIKTLLGIIFLVSGLTKSLDSNYFGTILTAYGIEWFYYLTPIIVFAELLLGLALLLGLHPRAAAYAGMIIVVLFTMAYAYGNLFMEITDCGCFGKLKIFNTSPRFIYLRNLLLVCGLWFIRNERGKSVDTRALLPIGSLLIFSGAFICGNTLRHPDHSRKTSTPGSIALTKHILHEFIHTNPDSTYLVTVFSYTCPHCINSMGNLMQYESFGIVNKVIGLCLDNPEEEVKFKKTFRPSFEIRNYPLEELSKLSEVFPQSYFIKNDSITDIIPGEIPSAYFFLPDP